VIGQLKQGDGYTILISLQQIHTCHRQLDL